MSAPGDQELDFSRIDTNTRKRCGSLSAHGLSDLTIADILLLSIEQVVACRASPEFKEQYAAEADRSIQAQIDRDEGWDALEEEAVSQLLQNVKVMRDPKFALMAAATANRAIRRKQSVGEPKVADASKVETNIIILNLNKGFVESSGNKTIDITPKKPEQIQRRSDLPSPKAVDELLAPLRKADGSKVKPLSELEQLFHDSGVVFEKP